MKTINNLVKRNFLLFFRDKGTVFFSVMSMLIVILLMVVFLGEMNSNELVSLLEKYGGNRNKSVDMENAKELIEMWTIAGILIINTVTVSISAIGLMVQDSSDKKMPSFYAAPVSKLTITMGYLISSVFITTIMCMLTLVPAQIYLAVSGRKLLGIDKLGGAVLLILVNAVIFSFLMYLLALFIKSMNAWSGLATIVGTLVGFIGAIYLPMGMLPEKVATALAYLPVLHGTSLMRKLLMKEILEETFAGAPTQVLVEYQKQMGILVEMQDKIVSSNFQICFLIGCGIIALITAVLIQKKRTMGDN